MEFAIALATYADSWKIVQRAEELGYDAASFFDTQMLNADPFVAMAAAASALGSLNALAPGRIEFGISTGFTGRRTMGLKRVKQADMKEYIRVVQGLLRGETLEWEFEGKRRKIRFLNPEIGAINLKDEIPLYISATGPRARALVAELGAGWIFPLGRAASALEAIADMKAKWQAAGRDLRDLRIHGEIGGAVLRPGEAYDAERVKDEAGPTAIMLLHDIVEEDMQDRAPAALSPVLAARLEQYRRLYERMEPKDARYLANHVGHLMFLKPEERAICDGELIRNFSWTAPKDELRDRIRALRDAGVERVSAQIRHTHPQMLEEWWEVFQTV